MTSSAPEADFVSRKTCPGCAGTRVKTLVDKAYADQGMQTYLRRYYGVDDLSVLGDAHYALERCERCGLAFQRDVPAGRFLHVLYNAWLGSEERAQVRASHTLEDYRYLSFQIEALLRELGRRPSEVSVLDFGMGWGEWVQMARAWGCEVAGAELSQVRIDHARSMGIPVVAWDDIPGSDFDFINTEQVFEHLVEPREVLAHLKLGLKPGGLLKISVPDARKLEAMLTELSRGGDWSPAAIMPIAPLEHINAFDHRALVAMGESVGLEATRPALGAMLNASSGWFSPRGFAKNIARPVFRHVYPKSTYVFFRRA